MVLRCGSSQAQERVREDIHHIIIIHDKERHVKSTKYTSQ